MKKRLVLLISVALIVILLASFLFDSYFSNNTETVKSPFYVGVWYCGNTTEGAKLLIDRVKNYTNLFVVGNGLVFTNQTSLDEVCDYAVANDLNFIVNLGTANRIEAYEPKPKWTWQYDWLVNAKDRWGEKFLGVYYYDEPGGTHLDANWGLNASVNPILTPDNTSAFFEWVFPNFDTGMKALKADNIKIFTSDYALYWFDYLAGFNVILAEIGTNSSLAQTTALVRGAANMQGKDWGVTVTWKYNGTPYLDSADAIYQQMMTAYQCGATYELIFNYPTYPENNSYGVLTDEDFQSLEKFWNDITSMPPETHGSIKAQTALVLSKNYGGGLRGPVDKIWGVWLDDGRSPQIWNISQSLLAHYNYTLDIIFDDSAFPVGNRYQQVYYWNDTYVNG